MDGEVLLSRYEYTMRLQWMSISMHVDPASRDEFEVFWCHQRKREVAYWRSIEDSGLKLDDVEALSTPGGGSEYFGGFSGNCEW
jgi:hypothetical protein